MKKKNIIIISCIVVVLMASGAITYKNVVDKNNNLVDKNKSLVNENEELNNNVATLEQEKEEEENLQYLYPIDIEYKEASKVAMNTYAMMDTGYFYGDKWKVEMESYYEMILEKVDGEMEESVLDSQEAWELSRLSDVYLREDFLTNTGGGGTIEGVITASRYYDTHRERALYLMSLYELLDLHL
jgi:uncharacterized protein YxeA